MTTQPSHKATGSKHRLVEQHSIRPIPDGERRGSAKGLFGFWFSVNLTPLTVVVGALGTTTLGLSFWIAGLAMVIGNLVGGVFMALHASQGPTLGVPQMLQSRAQFGAKGASLIVAVAAIMFMGFYISLLVIGAQSLHQVYPAIGTTIAIIITTAVGMAVTVVGLPLIKFASSIAAVVIGALLLLAFVWILVQGIPAGTLSRGGWTAAGFFSLMAIAAVWQIAYAPYVSDYSRNLPADGGQRPAFWATYGGSVLSGILVMALGLLVGAISSASDTMAGLAATTGSLATVILLAFVVFIPIGCAVNVYCATLNILTIIETIRPGWKPAVKVRLATTAVLFTGGMMAALAASNDFLTSFTNFVTILLYVLIPWSAINLVDYFLVAQGDYDIEAFFRADGGHYGRWNRAALAIYALGLLVQIPFAVLPQYVGPIAERLNEVDLAWMVGLLVSGVVYLLVARTRPTSQHNPAEVAANDARI